MDANKIKQLRDQTGLSFAHSNGKIGAMVELLCETDFVAKNQEFKSLAHDIVMHITAMKPNDNEELLAQPFVKNPAVTVGELITRIIQKVGENIKVGRFEIFEI